MDMAPWIFGIFVAFFVFMFLMFDQNYKNESRLICLAIKSGEIHTPDTITDMEDKIDWYRIHLNKCVHRR